MTENLKISKLPHRGCRCKEADMVRQLYYSFLKIINIIKGQINKNGALTLAPFQISYFKKAW